MATLSSISILLASLFVLSSAVPRYREAMPNPQAHTQQGSGITCQRLGHTNCATGKQTVNAFGRDFAAAAYTWTKEFCEKDSDGDGVSNGAELGDPCCVFGTTKIANRSTDLSHPGESDSKPQNPANQVCSTATAGDTPSSPAPPASPAAGSSGGSTSTPNESAMPNDTAAVCFPANAKVTLDTGVQVSMSDIRVGDRVQVGQDEYSEVFMFTHALDDVEHKFVSLETASGNEIELTAGHHIYASGKLIRAGDVEIGAKLRLADGTSSDVVKIGRVTRRGLFNPQTVHGDIVVGGLVSSTYTEIISSQAAHALLSPLRMLYAVFGLYTSALDRGVESYFG